MGVVGAGPNKAHGKDGIEGDSKIIVMAVFEEGVEDRENRVRGAHKAQCERHSFVDNRIAIVHLSGQSMSTKN